MGGKPRAKPARAASNDIARKQNKRLFANVQWQKVDAPVNWNPEPGDELIGYFVGHTKRMGRWGEYTIFLIHVPNAGYFHVTGSKLIRLSDSTALRRGDLIRVKFKGSVPFDDGTRTYKDFDLFIEKRIA